MAFLKILLAIGIAAGVVGWLLMVISKKDQ